MKDFNSCGVLVLCELMMLLLLLTITVTTQLVSGGAVSVFVRSAQVNSYDRFSFPSDPYAVVVVDTESGTRSKSTNVVQDSNSPSWNKNITFLNVATPHNARIKIELYDEDKEIGDTTDDYIGSSVHQLSVDTCDFVEYDHRFQNGYNSPSEYVDTTIYYQPENLCLNANNGGCGEYETCHCLRDKQAECLPHPCDTNSYGGCHQASTTCIQVDRDVAQCKCKPGYMRVDATTCKKRGASVPTSSATTTTTTSVTSTSMTTITTTTSTKITTSTTTTTTMTTSTTTTTVGTTTTTTTSTATTISSSSTKKQSLSTNLGGGNTSYFSTTSTTTAKTRTSSSSSVTAITASKITLSTTCNSETSTPSLDGSINEGVLSSYIFVAIVVGVIVFLIVAGMLMVFFCDRRKQRRKDVEFATHGSFEDSYASSLTSSTYPTMPSRSSSLFDNTFKSCPPARQPHPIYLTLSQQNGSTPLYEVVIASNLNCNENSQVGMNSTPEYGKNLVDNSFVGSVPPSNYDMVIPSFLEPSEPQRVSIIIGDTFVSKQQWERGYFEEDNGQPTNS
eukprot:m.3463 g.3463  ORF g.3463 m.3463 type:complete len:561 (-) comp2073_c0_seq1:2385-4067(-)